MYFHATVPAICFHVRIRTGGECNCEFLDSAGGGTCGSDLLFRSAVLQVLLKVRSIKRN